MRRAAIGDGAELEYELTGRGEPVLLIHGSHIARSYLELCAKRVLTERHTLIRYHRRGHLGSTAPEGPLSVAEQAADARVLLDHLGVPVTHVVGHSSGGTIALQLAADAPDRVRSLVLMEPAVLCVPLAAGVRELNAYAAERYRSGHWDAAEDLFLGGPRDRATLARSVPGGIEQALRDMDTYFRVEMPAVEEWGFGVEDARRYGGPVLYVLGADTQPLYVQIREQVCEWLPQTETVVIDGATHLLHMQQPAAVATALRAFLDRHRTAAGSRPASHPVSAERYNAAVDLLDAHVERGDGGRTAIVTSDGTHTYAEVALAAARAGGALRELGVEAGDRVLIALLDGPDFAATFFGAIRLGAIPVPAGTDLAAGEYAALLEDSGARVAVVSVPAAESLRAARELLGRLRHLVVAGDPAAGEVDLAEIMASVDAEVSPADTGPEDPCFWLYATGRGERPARVVHRQRTMRRCAEAYGAGVLGLGRDDVTFSVCKLHTAYGLGGGLYLPFAAGATSVLIAEPVLPRVVVEVARRFSPSVVFALPSTYATLVASRGDDPALRSVRHWVSSGGHLPGGVLERWRRAGGPDILEGYGLPESGHIFISARAGEVQPDCMGRALDGYEVRVTDPTGRDLPPGRTGVLMVRGRTIITGGDGAPADGWLDTGELSAIGDSGHVYHRGRRDEAVAAGGMLVHPGQIEAVLRDDPRVRECTVVARPDDDGLLRPEAFVVVAPGADPQSTEDALRQRVRQRLGSDRTPRRFNIVQALPSSAGVHVIRSPHPDVELPETTIPAYVLGRAAEWGDRPAVVDGVTGATMSYGRLAESVRRVAAGLAARGVVRGDVLALLSPNCPEFAITYYATLSIGAVITTINPLATAHDIARQLDHGGARWMLTTPQLLDEKGRDAASSAGVREVFVTGEAEGATSFTSLLADAREGSSVEVGPDDVALLPYSSGTTGVPKGVVLTHRNLVASLRQTGAVHGVHGDDVVIAALPMFHIYCMQVTLNLALHEGATVVIMPRFELEGFLRLVQEHGVTRAEVVPPIVLALAKQPVVDDFDVSSLRILTSAAAPLGDDLARACAGRIGCRVKQCYGMTELGGVTHCAPDSGRDDPESIGPALPGVECRVLDVATGFDVDPGEAGELLVRASGTMRGYLDNPRATADTIDRDGWVRTGDLVTVDEEGWFRISDRLKELIKYKGNQVAPAELESVLVSHPAVGDVAVIGSPDPEAGEVPMAFVVLRSPASADELIMYVAERVAPYKKVRRIQFVDEIPKSPSGKILRRLLIERERAVRAGAFATAER